MPFKMPLWTEEYPGLQYYDYQYGSASKYWAIWKHGTRFTTYWGRIGNDPQTSQKSFSSPSIRDLKFNQIIDTKLDKGYKLRGSIAKVDNPILTFPKLGNKIVPGKEHDATEPKLGNLLDMLELD